MFDCIFCQPLRKLQKKVSLLNGSVRYVRVSKWCVLGIMTCVRKCGPAEDNLANGIIKRTCLNYYMLLTTQLNQNAYKQSLIRNIVF